MDAHERSTYAWTMGGGLFLLSRFTPIPLEWSWFLLVVGCVAGYRIDALCQPLTTGLLGVGQNMLEVVCAMLGVAVGYIFPLLFVPEQVTSPVGAYLWLLLMAGCAALGYSLANLYMARYYQNFLMPKKG